MKMFIGIVAVVLVCSQIYKYTGWTPSDLLPAKPVKVRQLNANEYAALPEPEKIPDIIYKNTFNTPNPWARPLYGDKKTVVFVECASGSERYLKFFKQLLKQPEYKEVYNRQIYISGGWMWVYQSDTAKQFILETCTANSVCILNPRTREIVPLNELDEAHLVGFLEKYKNW